MYASSQDMIDTIGASQMLLIADRDDSGAVDAGLVEAALLDAGAEIDSAIGARYDLPLSAVPRRLRRVAIDLAHFHLNDNPTEDLMMRVKDHRQYLRDVARGIMTLQDAPLAEAGESLDEGGSQADLAEVRPFKSSLDLSGLS